MNNKSFYERGSIMVEVIAVLALLGTMSVLVFRQVQQRHDDLENINMASEIRMVKEATIAYIQANRAALETRCNLAADNATDEWQLDGNEKDEVADFLPENWASDGDGSIMDDYDIYMTCYLVNPVIAPRKVIYGTIIPQAGALGDLSLRRISKIAGLIGSDGGVFDHTEGGTRLHGTMGAWEVDCPMEACDDRHDSFFVATTGMDIYIPEIDQESATPVAMPHSIAFEDLHSTNYFSVGQGTNCVGNYDPDTGFAHENLDPANPRVAPDDQILHVGEGPDGGKCDPLFWVGVPGSNAEVDKSTVGQVYVKNNLYIGRDNTNNRQAVAIETDGDKNDKRKITVFDTTGNDRLTLDGTGKVVGRSNGSQGYYLDATAGEIVLFNEANVILNGETRKVQVPTLRLKNGVMDTGKEAPYGAGTYRVDPEFTSVMNDITLASRGGAKLSEILPNYISKGIYSITQNNANAQPVPHPSPSCPDGYVRAIMVTPVSWSQYVQSANLTLNQFPTSNEVGDAVNHHHSINMTLQDTADMGANQRRRIEAVDGNARLTLVQKDPVTITITDDVGNSRWTVGMTYGNENPTANDAISAIAQTFCVYDSSNFAGTGGGNASEERSGTGFRQNAGSKHAATPTSVRSCTDEHDCSNTEKCESNVCKPLGTCAGANGSAVSSVQNGYCIDGHITEIECTQTSDCDNNKTCVSLRCK